MTLDVKYLPAEEEAALLRIFFDKVDPALIDKLVAIANDLRKAYPDVLPLPIAPRTLIHIVEHIQHYPGDSVTDIFTKTYNPSSIVEDPAIGEAISRVLQAHDLAGKNKAATQDKMSAPKEAQPAQKFAPTAAASDDDEGGWDMKAPRTGGDDDVPF
jgi:hypothetical protein